MHKLSPGARLGSALLDHVFMCILAALCMAPIFINMIADDTDRMGTGIYLFLGIFAIYFCKDSINGRSLAKRVLKHQVTDKDTNIAASPLQCLVRNLFLVIWPVEVIAILVNPERRIGDRVAGTKVVWFDHDAEQPKTKFSSVVISLVLGYAFMLLLNRFVLPHSSQDPRHPVESAYNVTESKSLEKLFADSMGTKLSAEVKIYDSIEHYNIKYIHVVFNLKKNYLADESMENSLRKKTMELLFTIYPKDSFTGFARYVFRDGHSARSSSNDIGKRM